MPHLSKAFLRVLAFPFLLAAGNASALDGYGKTKWGMDLNEVLRSEPNAVQVDPPEQFKDRTSNARINSVEIEGNAFVVKFLFNRDGRLDQVNLAPPELNGMPTGTETLFEALEKLLTQKYGTPVFRQENKRVNWTVGKTAIELQFYNMPGILTALTVTYQPTERTKAASDNL